MWRLWRITLRALGILGIMRLCFAYIDPNTGGLIFQLLAVLLASITGILLFFTRQIRITTAKAKRFLRGILSTRAEDSRPTDVSSQSGPDGT